jgi:hypothetical protein
VCKSTTSKMSICCINETLFFAIDKINMFTKWTNINNTHRNYALRQILRILGVKGYNCILPVPITKTAIERLNYYWEQMSNHLNEEFLRNNPGEPVPYPFEPINPSPNKKVSLKRKLEKKEDKAESPKKLKQLYLPNIFT